jgi:putative membrane protein
VQSFFICLGDVVLLKIQCIHPVYFICAGLFCSFIYVSLVYALAIAFKHIGKAFAVILVILQIPGSSGTYPIQMMPEFFQRIYPLLPFTYGIDAMRETIAGMYDHYYAKNMLILLMFLVVALIIGLCFRPALMNLNHLFDKKLEETEIMVGETDSVKLNRPHLRLIINALLNDEKGKEAFMKRWVKFERKYPKLIKYGLRSMLIIPSIFLILMFGLESKLIFLILWIGFIVGLAVYLIVVEYMHNRIEQELSLSGLASEDLIAKMKEDRE